MAVSLSGALAGASVRVGWTTRERASWAFELAAIREACAHLGVTGDVVVGCAEYSNGRYGGMYSFRGGEHTIRVRRTTTAEQASRILWHELTHAAQHERGARGGTRRLMREDYAAYRDHPREREARGNEANAAWLPLARAR